MINIIEDLRRIFKGLDSSLDKKLISKKIFAEMYLIDDFVAVKGEMNNLLNEISHFKLSDYDEDVINTALANLHFKVSWSGRRVGECRETIEVIMGHYRKLVREQGYAKD